MVACPDNVLQAFIIRVDFIALQIELEAFRPEVKNLWYRLFKNILVIVVEHKLDLSQLISLRVQ